MPAWLIIAAVALAVGEGINLAGQGSRNIADSVARTALLSAALYVGYVALKAK